jgi:hypothetical protein
VVNNSFVDNTHKLPVGLYVGACLFFPAPGVVLLFLDGHHSAAFLIAVGMAYATGLGRTLMWRRLGRPVVPPGGRQARDRTETQRPD